jgi:hypothetical protein
MGLLDAYVTAEVPNARGDECAGSVLSMKAAGLLDLQWQIEKWQMLFYFPYSI